LGYPESTNLKLIGIETYTRTNLSRCFAGENFHWRAAAKAASSSI
jgi:hypothetical protein